MLQSFLPQCKHLYQYLLPTWWRPLSPIHSCLKIRPNDKNWGKKRALYGPYWRLRFLGVFGMLLATSWFQVGICLQNGCKHGWRRLRRGWGTWGCSGGGWWQGSRRGRLSERWGCGGLGKCPCLVLEGGPAGKTRRWSGDRYASGNRCFGSYCYCALLQTSRCFKGLKGPAFYWLVCLWSPMCCCLCQMGLIQPIFCTTKRGWFPGLHLQLFPTFGSWPFQNHPWFILDQLWNVLRRASSCTRPSVFLLQSFGWIQDRILQNLQWKLLKHIRMLYLQSLSISDRERFFSIFP